MLLSDMPGILCGCWAQPTNVRKMRSREKTIFIARGFLNE